MSEHSFVPMDNGGQYLDLTGVRGGPRLNNEGNEFLVPQEMPAIPDAPEGFERDSFSWVNDTTLRVIYRPYVESTPVGDEPPPEGGE